MKALRTEPSSSTRAASAHNCWAISPAPHIWRVCGGRVSSGFNNYRLKRWLSLVRAARRGFILYWTLKEIAGGVRQEGSALSEVRPRSLTGMAPVCFWSLHFSLSTPAFQGTFQQLTNQRDQGQLGSSGWRWNNHFTVQVSRPMQQPVHLYRFCKINIISFPSSRLTCLSKTGLSPFAHECMEVLRLDFSVLVCSAGQSQPLDCTPSCLVLGIAFSPLPQPSGLAVGVF